MSKPLLILLLIAGVIAGCSGDNFLDVSNENELSSDNYYTRIDHFDMSLNGVYSATKSLDLFGQTFYVETLLALPHTSDYWNAQSRNEVTSGDANVLIAWRGWYRVVSRANDIIESAPEFLEEQQPNQAIQDELDLILGQAHFLRGFAYFHMVRLWGEDTFADDSTKLAVPLILEIPSTRDDMMKPRASVGQVYNQVIADFKKAEELLPDAWFGADVARVDKYAAKGFLGKAYLYMEEYSLARGYFEELINNPNLSLLPYNEYKDLFHGQYEFSTESVFELNYSIDMEQNIWENGLGSGIALSLAPPGRGWSNVTPHGVNVFRLGDDPRAEIALYDPEDSVATSDGDMEPAGESEFNYTGHSFKKYVPQSYSVYSTNRNSGINYLVMRMADVYLMYAETMNELGNDNTALEYVNKVRRRAYGFNPETPEPSVDFSGLGGSQLQDSLREERFRELFAEGHRWYDIVRWDIVEEEVTKYNDYRVTQGPIIYHEWDKYYPIPLQEVNTNQQIVPSNGYE
ncbi:RagB/SusD family nutrient uptake outer membrane protein [Gracilimonas mengyeensis]|uniref:Starch-binding associating with outer membrane n=1 Tax=Gracilimonas mengyeensis TaxID=1302730 RepID=A0A521FGR2_9BACT|nr:RagB/SusD family nutrient uptake outer membrane protein [Gracilimonas mengyeensis]SMO95377.1 Starch-binding associating with outer membrane [Gracilimonas mengyeensis]